MAFWSIIKFDYIENQVEQYDYNTQTIDKLQEFSENKY